MACRVREMAESPTSTWAANSGGGGTVDAGAAFEGVSEPLAFLERFRFPFDGVMNDLR